MPNRDDVLKEARRWIKTPFHHQACVFGQGVDCASLIVGVGFALGLMPMLPTEERRYGRVPEPEKMRRVIAKYLDPVEGVPKPGDILYMGWKAGRPMHMGFLTELHGRGILHAYSDAGAVVETALPPSYDNLIESWWKYRGLEE